MKAIYRFTYVLIFYASTYAQTPPNITFPNPTPNPLPSATNTFTRATSSINLLPGFVFTPNSAFLNLNISSYPAYVNNNYQNPATTPNYYSHNSSLDAAVLPGNYGVDNIGALSYDIPIESSAGTAGIEPQLSISYNSNEDNNWLGLGFNLSGISKITRTGKTLFFDGVNDGVRFASTDVFSLDGTRLLQKSGVYGQNGTKYKTEVENYYFITSIGFFGSGPLSFSVTTPEGLTMEYGVTANSRHLDAANTDVLEWYINKIYDVYGNYMTYTYINTDGEILIDKIEYTGNGSTSPYNKIEFEYVDRSDVSKINMFGKEFQREHLLKEIICWDMNKKFRTYTLDYQYEFASLLSRITLTDAFGSSLNPTFFEWRKDQKSGEYQITQLLTQSIPLSNPVVPLCQISIPADLNGDGMKDLLLIKNHQTFEALVKTSSNTNILSTGFSAFNAGASIPIYHTTVDYINSFVFDEDDDDIEEVFIIYSLHAAPNSNSITYFIDKIKNVNGTIVRTNETINTIATANPLSMWSSLSIFHPYRSAKNTSMYFYAKEDVTGDNLRDVILVDQTQLRFTPSNNQGQIIINSNQIIRVSLGDFDGDGVLEIYLLKDVSQNGSSYVCEVYKYNPSLNALNLLTSSTINTGLNPYQSTWPTSFMLQSQANGSKSIDFGDFNGDGKMDVFYVNYIINSAVGFVNILKSNGISFLPDNSPFQISTLLNNYEATYSAMDINNDGYSDLVLTSYDSVNYISSFDCHLSNGNFLTPAMGTQTYNDLVLGALADFNGDGALDYITQKGYTQFEITFNFLNQNNKKLINRFFNIKDDLKVKYGFLPGQYGFYLKNSPANNHTDFKNKKPSVYVAVATDKNNRQLAYGYQNGVFDPLGKGFLGFEKKYTRDENKIGTTINGNTGSGNISTFFYDPVHNKITKTESNSIYLLGTNIFYQDNPTNSLFQETIYNYTQSGTNYYLNSIVSTSKDYLSSKHNVSTTVFDNSHGGQILSNTNTNKKWVNLLPINSTQSNYTYQSLVNPINGEGYYRGAQITSIVSDNVNSTTFVNDLTHDSNGRLTQSVKNSNISASAVTTNYSNFNPFGQALNISLTAPDLAQARTKAIIYDATGRFILHSTNSLGYTEHATYDSGSGNVLQTTDITGKINKFEYDGLGRLVKTTSPTGAVNTTKYEWHTYTNGTQYYGLKLTNTYEGNGTETVYFNYDDTKAKTESSGFGGNTIVSEYVYSQNMLFFKSEPHFSNQTTYNRTHYYYDEYYRPTKLKVTDASNTNVLGEINYSYNPSSLSTYNKGYVKVETIAGNGAGTSYKIYENDEAGRIDKVIGYENSNAQHTSAYVFNQFNLPTQMTTTFPGGTGGGTTNFTYDGLGRRMTMNDPSTGLQTFNYNSIGELTLTSNSSGQYTYTYDQAGRLLNRIGSGQGTYNYEYVTSGDGLMDLKKIIGPSVVSEYQYDSFNRLIEKKETVGSGSSAKQFITQQTYDKYDRPVNYKYPGNFITTNEYDVNGYLYKIKNNNTTIWELTGMLSPGRVKDYNNSAAIQTQISYDNFLNLQQIDFGTISSQNYNINSATSNLLEQTQTNFVSSTNNYEGFDYDNFDRLIKTKFKDSNNNIQTKQNFSYNANGNLNHKDDCGDYVYGITNKPYNLTQIQNATSNISLNTLNVIYNDFNKVSQITESGSLNKQFDFEYGNDDQRIKMIYQENSQVKHTRYYQENYDLEETPNGYREWSYIYSPTGLAAIYYNNNGTSQLLDVTSDRLGSPLLLTNSSGQIVEESSFDAWGRKRNPQDWTYNNIPPSQIMIRGYTGHEHLDEVGLINMNGRVYDPVLGRFIQPDPVVQDPGNIQNFNRFSYVLNNPLKYTDPSGYHYQSNGGSLGLPAPNDIRGPGEPAVYVDGVRSPGYDASYARFHGNSGGGGGGGIGVATTQMFGVWTGNGPGQKGYSISTGRWLDFADEWRSLGVDVSVTGRGIYVNLEYIGPGIWRDPTSGKIYTSKPSYIGVITVKIGDYGDLSAQSRGGESYPGMIVLETSSMKDKGAVTLPPFTITGPGRKKDKDLKRHEHGHVLQYAVLTAVTANPITGYLLYIAGIGIPSLYSAATSSPNNLHQNSWTEKTANQLSYWFQGSPTDWNSDKYKLYKK